MFRGPVRVPTRLLLSLLFCVALTPGWSISAQDVTRAKPAPLDRVVRQPLAFFVGPGGSTPASVAELFRRLSLPFGFEEVGALAVTPSVDPAREGGPVAQIPVDGLTLREALDAFVAADPRYVWRDAEGVIVIRPVTALADDGHPLHRFVPSVLLEEVVVNSAVDAINMAVGHFKGPAESFPGTKRFSLDFPGGAIVDLLNAISRSHGELGWTLRRPFRSSDGGRTDSFQPQLALQTLRGIGLGLPGPLEPLLVSPGSVVIRGQEQRAGRFGWVRAERPAWEPADPLDRMVPEAQPMSVPSAVSQLARWFRVPFGFEIVGALRESVSAPHPIDESPPDPTQPPNGPEVAIGHLTLRAALDALVAADHRYEWREMQGVVVIRPVGSWNDPAHPLAQPAPRTQVIDAHLGQAVDAVSRAFGRRPSVPTAQYADDSRATIRFDGGSRLELLNAAVRGRGAAYWQLASGTDSVERPGGLGVTTRGPMIELMGEGMGHIVRLRPDSP